VLCSYTSSSKPHILGVYSQNPFSTVIIGLEALNQQINKIKIKKGGFVSFGIETYIIVCYACTGCFIPLREITGKGFTVYFMESVYLNSSILSKMEPGLWWSFACH
jgi:hypothetical protein